ncbi:MAG TPA: hypothetical protein VGB66_09700, partial [Longimicrobium sp.]
MKPRSAVLCWLAIAMLATPLCTAAPVLAQAPAAESAQPAGPAPGVNPAQAPGGAEEAPVATSEEAQPAEEAQPGLMGAIDRGMGAVNQLISAVFFFDVLFFTDAAVLPLVVLWLVLGAIFFTVKMNFINFRGFGHAIQVVRGKYSDPTDVGEVSHFQALSAALSATVGL